MSLEAKVRTRGIFVSKRGEYGDITQRCAYCGKPEVSWLWSISSPFADRHYCSLECAARDNQTINLWCALCVLQITLLLSIGLAHDIIIQNLIDSVYILLYGTVLVFQILMLYQVYVGRRPA